MKNIISYITIILITVVLGFYAKQTYNSAIKYENIYTKLASLKNVDNQVERNVENLLINLLGSIALEPQKKVNKEEKLDKLKAKYKEEITLNMTYFFSILFASLFLYFIISKVIYLVYLNIVSLVTLAFGVLTPIFLILVEKEVPLVGKVIIQFESNTLISSIEKLYNQESYLVAVIIFAFSIFFPFTKTILMFLSAYAKNRFLLILTKSTSLLSKWSMADVFVLAIFLVYLSSTKDGLIHSELEAGFYFFFTYAFLSLISSTVFNSMYKENTNSLE